MIWCGLFAWDSMSWFVMFAKWYNTYTRLVSVDIKWVKRFKHIFQCLSHINNLGCVPLHFSHHELKNLTDIGIEKGSQNQDLIKYEQFVVVQLLSRVQFNPMDCSTPGFPVHHQLPELAQTHVWVSDAIQPSHLLSTPSPPALNLSQHQDLFQWAGSLHQMAKVLEL